MTDPDVCSAVFPCHTTSSASDDADAPAWVFVGERRSPRAIALGVTWQDGRLAAKTLHDALRSLGLDPARQIYVNLFRENGSRAVDEGVLRTLHALDNAGVTIVAMGRAVQAALRRAGLPHRRMIHPAARGLIRARATYQAHVAAVLRSQYIVPEDAERFVSGRAGGWVNVPDLLSV